jgi:hypothetical protein
VKDGRQYGQDRGNPELSHDISGTARMASSRPQLLCPYRVWVPSRARMPLRAAAEPAGESFPGPPYDAVRPASANAHRKLIRSSTDIPAVIVPLTVRAPSPVQRHGVGPFHQLSRRPLRSQDEGAEDATLHTPDPFVVSGRHLGLFFPFHRRRLRLSAVLMPCLRERHGHLHHGPL